MNDEEAELTLLDVKLGTASPSLKTPGDAFNISLEAAKALDGVNRNCSRRIDTKIRKAAEQKLPEGDDAGSKQLLPGMVYRNGYGAFDVMTPPYNQTELAQYYETSSANHAAVDAKVANAVGLGYHLEMSEASVAAISDKGSEKQKERARRKIEKVKIVLSSWLDTLNDDDTFVGTLEKVVTDMQSVGNGYLEVGRKSNGEIGYVGHIPAVSVRVRRQKDGFVQIVGGQVVYFRNFGDQERANPISTDPNPNEILHFKVYSPINTYYGVPDIVSAGQALIGDIFAQQYNIDYFENKAVPRYVVTVKGAKLNPESEKKLFDFMQTNLKGQNHRTLVVPLPPDNDQTKVEFKMEAIEAGVQEASFGKFHESNRNDILAAHQVPLSKIGQGDISVGAALASDRTFRDQIVRPLQRMVEKKINRLIAEKTDIVVFKFNELTLTDELAQAQIHEKYARIKAMLPNEIRDEIGLPHIKGGDEPLELTARQNADSANNARGNDQRAQDRENNTSDGTTTVEGRSPKGEGPKGS